MDKLSQLHRFLTVASLRDLALEMLLAMDYSNFNIGCPVNLSFLSLKFYRTVILVNILTQIKTSIVTDKVMAKTKNKANILLKRIIIPDYHITEEISFILQ